MYAASVALWQLCGGGRYGPVVAKLFGFLAAGGREVGNESDGVTVRAAGPRHDDQRPCPRRVGRVTVERRAGVERAGGAFVEAAAAPTRRRQRPALAVLAAAAAGAAGAPVAPARQHRHDLRGRGCGGGRRADTDGRVDAAMQERRAAVHGRLGRCRP